MWYLIAAAPSIILHEVSHGWVANFFGDPTAKRAGRLSLNPFVHVDPFGSIILPLILSFSQLPVVGYAKPVPVNHRLLRNPRSNGLWVSIAGPAMNVTLSAVGLGICDFGYHSGVNWAEMFGFAFGIVNLSLAAFNMLPIPPFDGSALIERFVPDSKMASYYQLRERAMPFVLVLVVVSSYQFNLWGHVMAPLEQWWISLVH
jgi:Zn-dependent protease